LESSSLNHAQLADAVKRGAVEADKKMAMEYLLRAKAIYLKKLGAQHPNTKTVQGWIDDL
jgi:hypothetical protein